MMHTKAIISILILICISNIFVFSQQKQLFQNVFNITKKPIGVEILNSQSDYQNLEVTEDIAYQQLFRLLLSFEKEAAKQTNEGYLQRAEFLRNFLQRKAGLTLEQANVLKADALNFTNQFGCRPTGDTEINQSENYDSEKLSRELNKTLKVYRNRFRQVLGESSFDRFDKFVRKEFASELIYVRDLKTQTLLVGQSSVDYDYQSNQVIGYSYTEAAIGNCLNITNIVGAALTSSTQGEVDADYAEACNGRAEVYLYFPEPQPQDQFCIDGEHYFAREFGLPRQSKSFGSLNNSNVKLNQGTCSPHKYEQLPSSSDCLTVPPLPNVIGVSFQQIAPTTPNTIPIGDNPDMDNNPNTDDGLRIFPDDDTPGENANRQTIRIQASINEARSGVTVHFLNFDLDDPSDDPDIDPNGNGNDNHGSVMNSSAGHLISRQAQTNSQGMATVNFTVTMQPGDNFAIAASTDSTELPDVTMSGINLLNGSGATIETTCDGTDIVCRSEMLTVWRRLHIEVDSMGDVSGNLVSGATPNEVRVRRNATEIITLNNTLEPNRFENGRFVLGGSSLAVISNTANTITVQNNNQPTIYAPANSDFQLYDDDNFNDSVGSLNGDTGENITNPDTSLLTANSDDSNTNVFAPAYVRPVYDISDTSDNSIFQANVASDNATDIRPLFVDWNSSSTNTGNNANEFWSIYLLGSYQHTLGTDNDSATEPCPYPNLSHCAVAGIVDEITGVTGDMEGSGALIFLEIHRPNEISGYTSNPTSLTSMAVTVAHEAGHLFSCRHGDGGIMGNTLAGTPASNQYSPTMIRRIRVLAHP